MITLIKVTREGWGANGEDDVEEFKLLTGDTKTITFSSAKTDTDFFTVEIEVI